MFAPGEIHLRAIFLITFLSYVCRHNHRSIEEQWFLKDRWMYTNDALRTESHEKHFSDAMQAIPAPLDVFVAYPSVLQTPCRFFFVLILCQYIDK